MRDLFSPSILIWFIPAAIIAVLLICTLCYLMKEDILRLLKRFWLFDTKTYRLDKGIISNISLKKLGEDSSAKEGEKETSAQDKEEEKSDALEDLPAKEEETKTPEPEKEEEDEPAPAAPKTAVMQSSQGAPAKNEKPSAPQGRQNVPQEVPVRPLGPRENTMPVLSFGKKKNRAVPDRIVFCALIFILFWLVFSLYAKVNLLSSFLRLERAKVQDLQSQITLLKMQPPQNDGAK